MHWFWRAGVSLAAGAAVALLCIHYGAQPGLLTNTAMSLYLFFGGNPTGALGWQHDASFFAVYVLPALVVTAGMFLLLSRKHLRLQPGGETHCRKCRYILRGLTEPRCPECGERI